MMSNILDTLHELVTPQILAFAQDADGNDDQKKGILGILYALLAVRLTDEPTASRLASLDGDALTNGELMLEQLLGDGNMPVNGAGLLATLSQVLGSQFGVSASTASTLSLTGLPLAYHQIKQLAGEDIVAFLTPQKEALVAFLPTWLTALLPAGMLAGIGAAGVAGMAAAQVSAAAPIPPQTPPAQMPVAQPPASTPVVPPAASAAAPVASVPVVNAAASYNPPEKGGFLKAMLPFVSALIIGLMVWLMLKACQVQPTQVAVPPPATPEQIAKQTATPATLKLALDETGTKVFAFEAVAGDGVLAGQLTDSIGKVFLGAESLGVTLGQGVATEMPVLQYLEQIFGFMKGVPDASIRIEGKTIFINSSDQAALEKLLSDLRTALPKEFDIQVEPKLDAEAEVAKSLEQANAAIESLTANANPDELVKALNLQIINFASGSSEIPVANQEILAKAAKLMNEIDGVHLTITGHTDNRGSHSSNQKLSESRAKAVRAYLVEQGVPTERLTVVGASFDKPVASNATEQGRFANRRIEFTLGATTNEHPTTSDSKPSDK